MTDDARDSAGRFRKGKSGNPAGKPVTSAKYRALLAGLADDAIRVLRESLADGDTAAAQFVLGRLVPNLRPVAEPAVVKLPEGTLSEQGEAILRELASGRLSADDVAALLGALSAQHRLIEQSEVLPRLEALEQQTKVKP